MNIDIPKYFDKYHGTGTDDIFTRGGFGLRRLDASATTFS